MRNESRRPLRPSVAQIVAYVHTAEGLVVAGSEAQSSAQSSVTISGRTTALRNTSLYSGVNDSKLMLLTGFINVVCCDKQRGKH